MLASLFMTKDDFYSNRYAGIQALRGIAAMIVILEHVRFLACGAFGVDIFFCISGFMIMLTTQNNTRHFFKKRLIRILPLYYIMTLATWIGLLIVPSLFQSTQADVSCLIKSLLCIPFDMGQGSIRPLMGVGWTINCEMFFYLIFFIAMKIHHKYRGLLCTVFLLILMGIASLPIGSDSILLQFYGNPVMLEFGLGIGCFYVSRWMYEKYHQSSISKSLPVFLGLLVCGMFLVLLLTKHALYHDDFNRFIYWGIPAFVLVLIFFFLGMFISFPGWLVHLGDMSFSIYLIHYYPVIVLDRLFFDFGLCSLKSIFGLFFVIGIVLILSEISYRLIEKRLSTFLKKLWIQTP